MPESNIIAARTSRPAAVRLLARRAGLGDIRPRGMRIAEALIEIERTLGRSTNRDLSFASAQALNIPISTEFAAAPEERPRPPEHCNGVAPGFGNFRGGRRPGVEFRVAQIRGGYCCHMASAPVVFSAESVAVEDFSSAYAGLCHFYDLNFRQLLNEAVEIDGAVVVLGDGLNMPNYCHWVCDWLPRLAFLRERAQREKVYVAMVAPSAEYQRESLLHCGVDEKHIVPLAPFQAVRARELLVPDNLRDIRHPALRASRWALDYLRSVLVPPGTGDVAERKPRKLYLSRSDAARRRVANEEELFATLEKRGYERVVLSDCGIREQARLFSDATHIVAPHGAGLANLVFASGPGQVVELFAPDYGTPAFYMLAGAINASYATYVVEKKIARSRSQLDDMVVDVADFWSRCGHLL